MTELDASTSGMRTLDAWCKYLVNRGFLFLQIIMFWSSPSTTKALVEEGFQGTVWHWRRKDEDTFVKKFGKPSGAVVDAAVMTNAAFNMRDGSKFVRACK